MKTVDISGMGGSYEWGCQKMLEQGISYLEKHPEFNFEGAYQSYKNFYGIVTELSAEAIAFSEAICFGLEPTGAMHQAVLSHLYYIHKHGREKWLQGASQNDGSRFFEFDGTVESCPKTALSVEMEKRKQEGKDSSEDLLSDDCPLPN